MHRNLVSGHSRNPPSAMPRFYTAAVAVNYLSPGDDEDNDICPVCDGDCTCNNRPRPLPSESRAETSSVASSGITGSSSASFHLISTSSTAGDGLHNSSAVVGPKRKGRPPKPVAIARDGGLQARGNEVTTLPQSQSHLSSHTHAQRSITSRASRPQVRSSKLKLAASRQTSKSQAKLTKRSAPSKKKQDHLGGLTNSDRQPSDGASPGRFPTFVSAVGLNDVSTEGDTDNITEEDEEEDEEMEEDEGDEETDDRASRVYTGIATGWSDDEESSFDADLFFANLTDTSSDDDTFEADHLHDSATDPLANSVTSLRSVDIEVTEAWDGQIVFTNGPNDGHGVLDLAFEADAAQLLASDSASINHDSDVEIRTSDGAECNFDGGDSELGASDGDTTEEELVDEQGLPTSRAMKLFRWSINVSSINPMSTVSPNVSPAPFSRRHLSSTILESPRPADILADNFFWEETDETRLDSSEGSVGESSRPLVRAGVPIMGEFSLEGDIPQKTAVLTGVNKGVPSPYPRRRRRFSSSAGSFSSMDLRGRTARLSIYPSLPPPSDDPSSETLPDVSLGEPIKLDDVLDSTFLDSEPEMPTQTIPDSEGEKRLVQNLSRWDRVPVGAFRLTREAVASSSDVGVFISPVRDGTHDSYDYDLYSNHRQQQRTPFKTRKESRREMKMMKRKTHAPTYHYDHHQRHHRRNHHPNMKSRSNASVQRTFFSSPTCAPALNI